MNLGSHNKLFIGGSNITIQTHQSLVNGTLVSIDSEHSTITLKNCTVESEHANGIRYSESVELVTISGKDIRDLKINQLGDDKIFNNKKNTKLKNAKGGFNARKHNIDNNHNYVVGELRAKPNEHFKQYLEIDFNFQANNYEAFQLPEASLADVKKIYSKEESFFDNTNTSSDVHKIVDKAAIKIRDTMTFGPESILQHQKNQHQRHVLNNRYNRRHQKKKIYSS